MAQTTSAARSKPDEQWLRAPNPKPGEGACPCRAQARAGAAVILDAAWTTPAFIDGTYFHRADAYKVAGELAPVS
ncbi:hypothetical protein GCM10022222_84770 [Amycolatopsis ultiminotia]|uniref:Uncharacterized protein n=1 Tax=Amycolatopsis ultiminotia TaxID=543629 RepID=A0ABP6YPV7_9PSEU